MCLRSLPQPRRDRAGKLVCEICSRRLNHIKHTREYGPGRVCHPRCQGTPAPSASADQKPPPTAAAPPPSIAPPTSDSPSHSGKSTLPLQSPWYHFASGAKWKYYPPVTHLRTSQARLLDFARSPAASPLLMGVNGAGSAIDMTSSPELIALTRPFEDDGLELLLMDDGIDTSQLKVMARKLLLVRPGEGPQFPHFDADHKADAAEKRGYMMYLTDGQGTAVWIGDPAIEKQLFYSGEYASKEERRFAAEHVVPANFWCPDVDGGTRLTSSLEFLHYGPHNEMTVDRWALYLLYSPDNHSLDQDNQQRLPLGKGRHMK